jgi:hypothetical protein
MSAGLGSAMVSWAWFGFCESTFEPTSPKLEVVEFSAHRRKRDGAEPVQVGTLTVLTGHKRRVEIAPASDGEEGRRKVGSVLEKG